MSIVAGRACHFAFLIVSMAGEAACCLLIDLEGRDKLACLVGIEKFYGFGSDISGEATTALFALRSR